MTSILSDTTPASATADGLPAGDWQGDPVHSSLTFSVPYNAGVFSGEVERFQAELADGRLEGSAEIASLRVKDENLQAHLLSPEFFDAERFPQVTFSGDSIIGSGDQVQIGGEITIRGTTHETLLTGTISQPMTDAFGNERIALALETTVDRTMFGITWNVELPGGGHALSNEVTLHAALQLVKKAED